MNLNIPKKEFEDILEQIRSEDSPVGIDAGKTHVLILYKLQQLEHRIHAIEQKISGEEG